MSKNDRTKQYSQHQWSHEGDSRAARKMRHDRKEQLNRERIRDHQQTQQYR
jgi:hypothetical protein